VWCLGRQGNDDDDDYHFICNFSFFISATCIITKAARVVWNCGLMTALEEFVVEKGLVGPSD